MSDNIPDNNSLPTVAETEYKGEQQEKENHGSGFATTKVHSM